MNERERFRASLCFEQPAQFSLQPGSPRESTLQAWHRQGLPEGANWEDALRQAVDLPDDCALSMGRLDVSFDPLPLFEEKVLDHRDGHLIVQDMKGAIVEISDEYDVTFLRGARDFVTRRWHRFPVSNRRDWEDGMRWRYDPSSPGRFPRDLAGLGRALRDRPVPIRLDIPGPFWQLRDWCGFENLCLMLIEEPDFVAEMIDFWTGFVLRVLEPVLEHVQPDYVQIMEDMAYKAHSMISPAMTRRFLLPTWQAWTSVLRAAGCPVLSLDSDGYIAQLLPIWIEAGFNCTYPVEVAAGNDIVAYRRQHGTRMAFRGGLDKRALAAGGETMRAEVMRVTPPLREAGGILIGCDHHVPPDISWPDFVEYTRLLARLLGWPVSPRA